MVSYNALNTATESTPSNTCNRRGNVYGGERTAATESTTSNTCNRRGNVYGGERTASFENIISNTCNRRGNVYGGERTATVESIISNTVMIILTIVRICHLYGFESIAIHECMISNVKCRSWNRYRFQPITVAEGIAFYSRDKIPTHIFLYFSSRT